MSSKTMFYILKRVLLAILTIWIVITITFFVMHAVPGGPFMSEKAITKEAQAASPTSTSSPQGAASCPPCAARARRTSAH